MDDTVTPPASVTAGRKIPDAVFRPRADAYRLQKYGPNHAVIPTVPGDYTMDCV